MKIRILLILLAIVVAEALAGEQRSVAVWGADCIHIKPDTRAEAPLVNGQPDWSHVKIIGVVLDKNCFVYKVAR